MNWNRKIAEPVDFVLLVSSILSLMGAFGLMSVARIRARPEYNEEIVGTLAENSYLALIVAGVLVLNEIWHAWRGRRARREPERTTCVSDAAV